MFPIRDDNPHYLTPIATLGIIGLTAAAWVFLQGMGTNPALVRSVCTLGLIPGELLQTVPPGTTFDMGGRTACVVGSSPSWWTPVTSMFMHGGWFHLLGNMWFLWIFGNNVEDSMGHARFVVFYLVCGLVAAAAQTATDPGSAIPMVGASGAIGGVMGAYVLLYPRVHVHLLIVFGFYVTTIAVPAFAMLGYWFLLQLVGGFGTLAQAGGVAFWAHAGGFVAGLLLIPLFKDRRLLDAHPYHGFRRQVQPSRGWRRIEGEPYYRMGRRR